MIIAELPVDEELRLADLASYEIMDSIPESEFEELVELAGHICKTPISLISLIDKNRQWFKARKGLDVPETPRDVAFCAHAILQDEVMEVKDATQDPRFFDNPLVTGHLNIRFYAGAPIVSPEGHKLGTVCIIDTTPRNLLPEEKRALTILSNQVTKLLELRAKNILLRQKAKEIIAVKSEVINNVLQQKEKDKKDIADKLHEDLAQSLASAMLYLQMSQENKANETSLVQTARQQLNTVLIGIRNLSYKITPPAVNWIPIEDLLKEFIESIAVTFPFYIHFTNKGTKSNCTGDKAIVTIRILEQWLKALANKKEVTRVDITIQTGKDFELQIADNAPATNYEVLKNEVFGSVIFYMAQSQGGAIGLSNQGNKKNILTFTLPLAAA